MNATDAMGDILFFALEYVCFSSESFWHSVGLYGQSVAAGEE